VEYSYNPGDIFSETNRITLLHSGCLSTTLKINNPFCLIVIVFYQ